MKSIRYNSDEELARAILTVTPQKLDNKDALFRNKGNSAYKNTPSGQNYNQSHARNLALVSFQPSNPVLSQSRSRLAAGSIREHIDLASGARSKGFSGRVFTPSRAVQGVSDSTDYTDNSDNQSKATFSSALGKPQVTVSQLLSEIARLNEKLEQCEESILTERALREESESQLNVARGERWAAEAAAESAIAAQRRAELRAAEIELSSQQLRQGQAEANKQAERELSSRLEAETRAKESLELRVEAAERAKRLAEDALQRECAVVEDRGNAQSEELVALLESERERANNFRKAAEDSQAFIEELQSEIRELHARTELTEQEIQHSQQGIGILGTKMLEDSRRIITQIIVPQMLSCNEHVSSLSRLICTLSSSSTFSVLDEPVEAAKYSQLGTEDWTLPTALEINTKQVADLHRRIGDCVRMLALEKKKLIESDIAQKSILQTQAESIAHSEQNYIQRLQQLQNESNSLASQNAVLTTNLHIVKTRSQQLEILESDLRNQLEQERRRADNAAFKYAEEQQKFKIMTRQYEQDKQFEKERADQAAENTQQLSEATQHNLQEEIERLKRQFEDKAKATKGKLDSALNTIEILKQEKIALENKCFDLTASLSKLEKDKSVAEQHIEELELQKKHMEDEAEISRTNILEIERECKDAVRELTIVKMRCEKDVASIQAECESRLKAAEKAVRSKAIEFLEEQGEFTQNSERLKKEYAEMQRDLEVLKVREAVKALDSTKTPVKHIVQTDEGTSNRSSSPVLLLHTPARSGGKYPNSILKNARPASIEPDESIAQTPPRRLTSVHQMLKRNNTPLSIEKLMPAERKGAEKGAIELSYSSSSFLKQLKLAGRGIRAIKDTNDVL